MTMKVGVIETYHSHTIIPSVVVQDTSEDPGPMAKGENRYIKFTILRLFGLGVWGGGGGLGVFLVICIGLAKHRYLPLSNFLQTH